MAEKTIPSLWRGEGSFEKAGTDEQGRPFVDILVTGPKADSQGETMTPEGRANFVKAAKDGLLDLVGAHNLPIPMATSVDAWEKEDKDVVVRLIADKGDPIAMKVHTGIASGAIKFGASGGGKCTRDARAKTYTPWFDKEHRGHIALTFPGKQAYPDAGPEAAFFKSLQEGDFEAAGFSPEAIKAATDAFAKDKGTWDSYSMINVIQSLESLRASEASEDDAQDQDVMEIDQMISIGKRWVAKEILEQELGDDEELQLSRKDDGSYFAKVTKAQEDEYIKRAFSVAQRRKLAKSGAAMKDGSFPIENESDLENAIKAYGRAKDKDAAKKHIMSRAKALGKTSLLPKEWTGKKDDAEKAKDEPSLTEFVKVLEGGDISAVRAYAARVSEWEKAGKRHSKADMDMIQAVHDHAVGLGATCSPAADEQDSAEKSNGTPSPTDFAKSQAYQDMEKTVSDLREQVATALEFQKAVEPMLKALGKVVLPSRGALAGASQAFAKERDTGSTTDSKPMQPPTTSAEAFMQAMDPQHLIPGRVVPRTDDAR